MKDSRLVFSVNDRQVVTVNSVSDGLRHRATVEKYGNEIGITLDGIHIKGTAGDLDVGFIEQEDLFLGQFI